MSRPPSAYGERAGQYDGSTAAYQRFREAIVDALPLRRGDTVVDAGCGTGLCFSRLLRKVGARGKVVGVDASSHMVALARERVARAGWRNVTVVQSPIAEAKLPSSADAALFCAVHDILRSPEAVGNVIAHLRPGSYVAAGGGKWAAPWMVALNVHVHALHRPYVRTFEGFHRPWAHLEQLVGDLRVDEFAFGSGYVATGRIPASGRHPSRRSGPRRAAHALPGARGRPRR